MTVPLQTIHPDYSDNPLAQAVKTFVESILERSVEDIKSCDIIQTANDGYAEFFLQFGDGSHGYKGSLRQGLHNVWSVHTFRAFMTSTASYWLPIKPTTNAELEWVEQQQKLRMELLSGLQLVSREQLEENHHA